MVESLSYHKVCNPRKRKAQKIGFKVKIMKEKTIGAPTSIINAFHKIAKDRKVIPDPIDDRKFQE